MLRHAKFILCSYVGTDGRYFTSVPAIEYPLPQSDFMQSVFTLHRPLVVCGPSGVGKSTLIKQLTKEFPIQFGFSVSHTTRKPRPGEKDGVHYHFVSRYEKNISVQDLESREVLFFCYSPRLG